MWGDDGCWRTDTAAFLFNVLDADGGLRRFPVRRDGHNAIYASQRFGPFFGFDLEIQLGSRLGGFRSLLANTDAIYAQDDGGGDYDRRLHGLEARRVAVDDVEVFAV